MSRTITCLPVPESHYHIQKFLLETLKDKYYQRQSLWNLSLALIMFFDTWQEKDKEGYHMKTCAQGDVGEIEVFYQEKGQDKIVIFTIKQEI